MNPMNQREAIAFLASAAQCLCEGADRIRSLLNVCSEYDDLAGTVANVLIDIESAQSCATHRAHRALQLAMVNK